MAILNLAVVQIDANPLGSAVTMGVNPSDIKYVYAAPGQNPVVVYLDHQSVKLTALEVTTGIATIIAGYSDWLLINLVKKGGIPQSTPVLINKNSITYQVQDTGILYTIMYNEGYEVSVQNKELYAYIDNVTVAAEAITAVDVDNRTFSAAANLAVLVTGAPFWVTGSTGGSNDGLYSAAEDATATDVIVNQNIPNDPVANGTVNA